MDQLISLDEVCTREMFSAALAIGHGIRTNHPMLALAAWIEAKTIEEPVAEQLHHTLRLFVSGMLAKMQQVDLSKVDAVHRRDYTEQRDHLESLATCCRAAGQDLYDAQLSLDRIDRLLRSMYC